MPHCHSTTRLEKRSAHNRRGHLPSYPKGLGRPRMGPGHPCPACHESRRDSRQIAVQGKYVYGLLFILRDVELPSRIEED